MRLVEARPVAGLTRVFEPMELQDQWIHDLVLDFVAS